MGLIKAFAGAVSSTFADQWKEYFYCEALPVDVLVPYQAYCLKLIYVLTGHY